MSLNSVGEWWRESKGWSKIIELLAQEMQNLNGGHVREVFTRLVDLVLLYGVELWGCGRQLGLIYRTCSYVNSKNFHRVGRLHPLVSLQFEMNMLTVKQEAMRRGIEVWAHVMMPGEGKIMEEVVRETIYECVYQC